MPAARTDPAIVYDEKNGNIIMFSGNIHLNSIYTLDTWAYDVPTNTWERAQPSVRIS